MAAVPVKMLLTKLRMRLADMQKTKFSDYELLSALSDAWAILWIALAERFSTLPRKSAEVTLSDGFGTLPDDFYSLRELSGGTVRGTRVEAEGEKVTLSYNCVPHAITSADSEIAFPVSLILDLIEVAASVTAGDMSAAAAAAQTTAARVAQKREHDRIPDLRPFP